MEYDFHIEAGEVVAKEIPSGVVAWQGKPEGSRAEVLLDVPETDDCIVLLDHGASDIRRAFPNLIRLRYDGTIVWHAELPEPSSADSYTEIAWDGPSLRGYSWSGYSVRLDANSGRIVSRKFVK